MERLRRIAGHAARFRREAARIFLRPDSVTLSQRAVFGQRPCCEDGNTGL